AGMIGEPGDRGVVLVDRDNSFDDADGDLRAVERAALLDVQLDVAVVRPLRANGVADAIGIAADLPDRVGARHPVPGFPQVFGLDEPRSDPAARDPASEGKALLVGPDDHLERL